MKFNIFEKIFNNKFVVVVGIICLITISCISLASASDVNGNVENQTAINNDSNFNCNLTDENSSLNNSQKVNDTSIINNDTENIDWSKYNVNVSDYKNPTIIHIKTLNDLKIASSIIFQAKQNDIELIYLHFDIPDKTYEIDPWFEQNLLHPTCKMLIIEVTKGATITSDPSWWDSLFNNYHFLYIEKGVNVICHGLNIENFDGAIINYGTLWYCGVFKNNEGSDATVLKNYGTAYIAHSWFQKNKGDKHAFIWSSKDSTLTLEDCFFAHVSDEDQNYIDVNLEKGAKYINNGVNPKHKWC